MLQKEMWQMLQKEMWQMLQMKRKNLKIFLENVSGENVQIQFSAEFCLVTHLQHLKFLLANKDS